MALVGQRTQLKNRIHANLPKYGATASGISDLFGVRGWILLGERLYKLPPETRYATERPVEELDDPDQQIKGFEERMGEMFHHTRGLELVETLP